MTTTTIIMCAVCMTIPLCGILAAIVPYLQRRTEVFAVTVPSVAQDDAYVKGLKRKYAAIMLTVTVALTLACAMAAYAQRPLVLFVLLIGGTFALMFVSYGLMLFYRRRMVSYKKERGWVAQSQQSVASLGEEPEGFPRGLSLKWNLLYIPVIATTVAIAAVGYSSMPELVPMHIGFDGAVDGWAQKSVGVVLFPVLLEAFLAIILTFCHWQMFASKAWKEPGAPASSAWAYGMFVRANSIVLVGGGVLLTMVMGIAFELYIVGVIGIGAAVIATLVACVPMVVASIAVSVVYGQCGSRVFLRMQTSDAMLVDDDDHWKLGIFYWAPEDASLFVPERFGVGWTINCARPAAWAIFGGVVVLTAVFVASSFLMVG